MHLVLGSTSAYRRQLLERLGLPFTVASPEVDETPFPGEAPPLLAQRLARAKAEDVASRQAGAWVLGSDQVAELDGQLLGKPGTRAAAIAQLAAMAGRDVRFSTALALARSDAATVLALDATTVRVRPLSAAEVERYVEHEPALDCAGSFKVEGLGICLFDAIASDDPTALVGLPLIATARLLRGAGFRLP